MSARMEEKVYRRILDQTFTHIDDAFEDVDPDAAEVGISQGTLTITFGGKERFMLTPQPSPRQLWVAFRDRAWHFDYDDGASRWVDDRGLGIDAFALVEETTQAVAGAAIKIRPLTPIEGGST